MTISLCRVVRARSSGKLSLPYHTRLVVERECFLPGLLFREETIPNQHRANPPASIPDHWHLASPISSNNSYIHCQQRYGQLLNFLLLRQPQSQSWINLRQNPPSSRVLRGPPGFPSQVPLFDLLLPGRTCSKPRDRASTTLVCGPRHPESSYLLQAL